MVNRSFGMSLFLIGAFAYRHQWVTSFPSKSGRVWLAVGLALAGFWYAYDLWLAGTIVVNEFILGLLLPLWESLLCCSMCIGFTVLFRDRVNRQSRTGREMANSTYAAYMLHVFIVIMLQYLALGFTSPPLLKFILVSLVAVPLFFLLANLIRRPLQI
jgi:surface polysaccharide O-acyltransferase-like enzyme